MGCWKQLPIFFRKTEGMNRYLDFGFGFFNQLVFGTEKALKYLCFEGSETV